MMLRVNCILLVTLALAAATRASAETLYEIPEGVETRWASPKNVLTTLCWKVIDSEIVCVI